MRLCVKLTVVPSAAPPNGWNLEEIGAYRNRQIARLSFVPRTIDWKVRAWLRIYPGNANGYLACGSSLARSDMGQYRKPSGKGSAP